MLTKWAKESLKIRGGNSVVPGLSNPKGCITAKHYNGDDIYVTTPYVAIGSTSFVAGNISTESVGVVVGTGDTPATETDYNLANKITSGLTGTVSQDYGYDAVNNVNYTYMTVTLTNTTDTDIIVKEIGMYVVYGTATTLGGDVSTGGGRRKCALTDRTVLETPVTVPANGSAVIRYQFDFPTVNPMKYLKLRCSLIGITRSGTIMPSRTYRSIVSD